MNSNPTSIPEQIYKSTDICVLTPTRDRPHKIVNLLKSLKEQTSPVGRIIVVATGQDVESVVRQAGSGLPVEYYYSEAAGQIPQRKLGVGKLDSSTRLVATLDDDIILEPAAIENLIRFWNSRSDQPAGIGLNIANIPPHKYSPIRALFFASAPGHGQVLKSGFVTSFTSIKDSVESSWLNGGASVWQQEVIVAGIHEKEMNAAWSPCEDLIFSYPVAKNRSLYVCADARVVHDDVMIGNFSTGGFWRRGQQLSIWLFYFVSLHPELSAFRAFIAVQFTATGGFLKALLTGKIRYSFFHLGRLWGSVRAYLHRLTGRPVEALIG